MRPRVITVCLLGLVALSGCSAGGDGGATRSPSAAPSGASSPASSPVSSPASGSASSPAATSSGPGSTPASGATAEPTESMTVPSASPAPSTTRPPGGGGGRTVVLNPGHNGGNAANAGYIARQVPAGYGEYKPCDTTGTETNAGYAEHAFTFDLAVRVRRILEASGLRVVLTRPNDIGVGPCVDERAAVGNRAGVAAVVSLHADGAPSSGHGFHVNQASRRPDGASARTAAASVRLGEALRRTLAASSGLTPSTYIGTDGMYFRSDFAALNLARRPATFLELGNMRNAGDAALLSSPEGRARIASAVAAGILAFLR